MLPTNTANPYRYRQYRHSTTTLQDFCMFVNIHYDIFVRCDTFFKIRFSNEKIQFETIHKPVGAITNHPRTSAQTGG